MTGKICGTGSWAPDRVWDNNDLAKMVETSDQWIRERTGVVQRHIAKEDEDTVTMAAGAALKALEDAEMKAEEIDLILVATISPTEIMPCVACGVQERLGAEKATCFDLNGACTVIVPSSSTFKDMERRLHRISSGTEHCAGIPGPGNI